MKETPLSNCERRFLLRAIEEKKVNWEFSAASAVGLQAARSLPAWMLRLSSRRPGEPQEEPPVLPQASSIYMAQVGSFQGSGHASDCQYPGI